MIEKVNIIAEAGVNHNGKKALAFRLIEKAKEIGASYVKFQTFSAETLSTKTAKKAPYQVNTKDKSQFEMLKKLELKKDVFKDLFKFSDELKIDFFSTPFDIDSLNFLCDLGMKRIKIPSGEITNGPLLLEASKKNLPIILSTGMSNLNEIKEALSIISYGILKLSKKITANVLNDCFNDNIAKKKIKKKVTLLHCTSSYPCPTSDANIFAIKSINEKFNIPTGFSDHTNGFVASGLAVTLGAKLLEKHFTLNKSMKGPDHKASLNINEFKNYIKHIREVESYLGSGEKKIQKSEKTNIKVIRKSIVAKKKIKKGELFSNENITFKRPAGGKSPMNYWKIINTKSKKNYSEEDLI